MDYPRDNAFTFLFSTYKRTAGIAFAAILLIAIPVTLGLLNQQQDIRQRAQVADSGTVCSTDNDCQIGFACMGTEGDESSVSTCQPITTVTPSPFCPTPTAPPCEPGDQVVSAQTAAGCPAFVCSAAQNASIFDLNDDGKLDGIDYNILYSNFSKRQGD